MRMFNVRFIILLLAAREALLHIPVEMTKSVRLVIRAQARQVSGCQYSLTIILDFLDRFLQLLRPVEFYLQYLSMLLSSSRASSRRTWYLTLHRLLRLHQLQCLLRRLRDHLLLCQGAYISNPSAVSPLLQWVI